MSDTQTHRQRFAWLDALARHSKQRRNVLRLAYVIANTFHNSRTGDAWPGQERLARELGVNVRTILRCIGWLIANGYLECDPGRGLGRGHGKTTDRYRLTLPELRDDVPKSERKPKPPRQRSIDASSFDAFW